MCCRAGVRLSNIVHLSMGRRRVIRHEDMDRVAHYSPCRLHFGSLYTCFLFSKWYGRDNDALDWCQIRWWW